MPTKLELSKAGAAKPSQVAALNGELRLTIFLFLLSFFGLGLPRIFTTNAAHTLFIEAYGPEFIPYAYIAQAVLIPVFGYLYMKADERLSLRWLVVGSMALDIVVLVSLWAGLGFTGLGAFSFVAMVWFEAEFVLCSLWLWGTATQLMNLRQGKRLFGYISAGEPLAIILCGLAIPMALRFIETEDLLLFSAFGVFLAICLVLYITTRFQPQRDSAASNTQETTQRPVAKRWYADRYVKVLVGIVVISQFGYFFTDTAFYLEASSRYPDEEGLSAFLGTYMACVGVVSLISSLFVSAPLLQRFGLKGALLLLPILLGVSALVGAIVGFGWVQTAALFWIVFIMKTMDQSIRYTVDKTASITLYQPLPATQRMQVQTALESIIEPLVGGISGLLLAVWLQVLGFGVYSVVLAILVVAVIWSFLVLVQDRYYKQALRKALNARRLGVGQISIDDPATIKVIVDELSSNSVGSVVNALGLIQQIKGFDRRACYERLLSHPDGLVRYEVLQQIAGLGVGGFDPERIREQASLETEPGLRAAALRTLVAIDPSHITESLLPLLSDQEEAVRHEAVVGLLLHGDTEGTRQARALLQDSIGSGDANQRRFAAKVLRFAPVPELANRLSELLFDPDGNVRAAAVQAVCQTGVESSWPQAVELLCDPAPVAHKAAAKAIIQAGDAALEPLVQLLTSTDVKHEARQRAAHVLGAINSTGSRSHLHAQLAVADRQVSESVLFALRAGSGINKEATTAILDHQKEVVTRAIQTIAWGRSLDREPPKGIEPVLRRALSDQLAVDIKSLFHIMVQLHPEADLADAWGSYRGRDSAQRAIAVEAIDSLLTPELRTVVLALLEHHDDENSLSALPSQHRPRLLESTAVLKEVFEAPASQVSPWTRAAALYTLLKTNPDFCPPAVKATYDPLCAELIDALGRNHDANWKSTMLTIEKVFVLRSTPIFDSVQEEQLVAVAEHAEPVELQAGDVLFEEGESGNAMYVVVDGLIKAHIGEKTLTELGPHDVVGEMAALDPEPRSATITAISHSLLLRINHESLQLLIEHNPNMARSIIKVLCARLRDAGKKAVTMPVH
ncbi:MAG TPA: HEAT repeat domain-containing protein [Xanthomonadales bacterium]|nr:HEAT repeat domain-containing protein [Xanthomonadales bacterium]